MLDRPSEAKRLKKLRGQQQTQPSWPGLTGPSLIEAKTLAACRMAGASPAMTTAEVAERPVTLGRATQALSRLFRQAGILTAQLDARLLAAKACGLSREESILKPGFRLR